ncbi:MAG TPA: hypothetical protein VGM81_13250 [Burkholderiaceae bacterium]|jgi:hypothetical protein
MGDVVILPVGDQRVWRELIEVIRGEVARQGFSTAFADEVVAAMKPVFELIGRQQQWPMPAEYADALALVWPAIDAKLNVWRQEIFVERVYAEIQRMAALGLT